MPPASGYGAYPASMTLPNGQQLRQLDLGTGTLEYISDALADPAAPVLVYHHGTPAAGPMDHVLLEAARAAGFRLVELVRPGYGGSTRAPGRTITSNTALTSALLRHLGVDRFASAGWSGGGPHTLADVALLHNCVGSVSIAGVGPADAPDLDFLAGMGQDNLDEFGAAHDSAALQAFLERAAAGLATVDGESVKTEMASLLPAADVAYLTDVTADDLAASLRWSVANGIWGWFDDDLAFSRAWGFDPGSVSKPVILLQGADDLMVPFAHGQWLAAHIPSARAHLVPGEGHLSVAAKHLAGAIRELRTLLD